MMCRCAHCHVIYGVKCAHCGDVVLFYRLVGLWFICTRQGCPGAETFQLNTDVVTDGACPPCYEKSMAAIHAPRAAAVSK